MNDPLPQASSAAQPVYVLTDASGRQYVSSAPAPQQPAPVMAPQPYMSSGCCSQHSHGQVSPAERTAPKSAGLYVAGALGAGAVVVSLVLSVAIVAAALGVTAVAVTCCLLVLRSFTSPHH